MNVQRQQSGGFYTPPPPEPLSKTRQKALESVSLTGLTPTETLIYQAYLQRSGKPAADKWLCTYLAGKAAEPGSSLSPIRSNGSLVHHLQNEEDKANYAKRALEGLLARANNREVVGEEALTLAKSLIGSVWKEKLGNGIAIP